MQNSEKAMRDAGLSEEEKQVIRSKDMNRIKQMLSSQGISVGGTGRPEGPEGPRGPGGEAERPIPITLVFDTSWITG